MKAIVVVAAVALVVVLVVTVAGDCTWSQDITSRSWDESVCPEPYILIGNTTCLYISQWGVVRNWSAAQTYCSVYEGELAVINDCALLGEVWTLTQHVLNLTGNFWVGGSDAEAEGSWVWERTVKSVPMGVPFWLPGHPDGDTHENKLMIADNGYFTDGNQTEEHYFICQDFSTLGSITG
ncbi:hypothetical protein Pmani_000465 [Petrolisthes manimaculis]|uniref:C-type lectin domain-containing protein n=1 Tax=Petrolisthes manimaculis TaxID=1843537 RepID=A0AAE1PX81_9EUCA|nr:hypothetical protein Pmani_013085 [Petrolisthes manimaculis]KAK4329174.1 hypothetical protein Pmani_000465 [Petrolisthes manimaculis]